MKPEPRPELRLDVILALRHAVVAFRCDFAAFMIAGVLLVTMPGVAARALPDTVDWSTLATTLRGVCAMLFVALVSWGVVARLTGHSLPPHRYLAEGLARATPGVKVALLLGAAVVAGLILQLFARHGTLAGWALNSLLLTAGLLALTTVMPAVPAAVVERLGPVSALRRAADLTAGNRDRLLALALLVGLCLGPTGALVAGIGDPDDDGTGLLLRSAFEFIAWSLVATVPAVVYALLRETPEHGL